MTLQALIDTLTFSNNIHVSILDLSGILSDERLSVRHDNRFHVKPVCEAAKSAPRGMRLCFACKILSTKKAVNAGRYIGLCPYGITEAVQTVYFLNKPVCIIYAGNLIENKDVFILKTKKCTSLTGGDSTKIISLADTAQTYTSSVILENICTVISDYISTHIGNSENFKFKCDTHYAVSAIENYANEFYQRDLTLKYMAKLYFLNENYLGRLFKKYKGISFSKYLNNLRIEKACSLLKTSSDDIISISASCGFNNVTYFNRVFKEKTGVTPKEYRNNT